MTIMRKIFDENSNRILASALAFCKANNFDAADFGFFEPLSDILVSTIMDWYAERENRVFNPFEEIVSDRAIEFAIARLEGIAVVTRAIVSSSNLGGI